MSFLDNNRTLSNDEVEDNLTYLLITNIIQSNNNNDTNVSLSFENSFIRDIIDFGIQIIRIEKDNNNNTLNMDNHRHKEEIFHVFQEFFYIL